ncbi:MAG: flagellin [Lachnospiraceae bacterium]|nr:flagellin [Lachnospiraceae bacterium]
MVVQHNMQAFNSNRMLGITSNSQAKSTEKLSSGYRINRAADDAAGLSISEKMRKQINGLDRASTNAQDGVSSVQTAEGALTEVHSMLQRMNELAVQAANGTNSESDRQSIQDEIDQLVTEIDRVAETTKFNETYLLKGDSDKGTNTDTVHKNIDLSLAEAEMAKGGTFKVVEGKAAGDYTVTFTTGLKAGSTWNGKEVVATANDVKRDDQIELATAKTEELAAMNNVITKYSTEMGLNAAITLTNDGTAVVATAGTDTFAYNKSLTLGLHVGADSDSTNKISLRIEAMSADSLHLTGLQVSGKTSAPATRAIDTIAAAIQKVSSQRSALGAVQNRLEHTIDNLDNVVENTTAAESRIRDTDMAEEMVNYSKNNILQQAGQAMLAQANQSNQGVLSLLG